MPLIDFGELEKHIKSIETVFEKAGLNQIEQNLVLQQANLRLQKKIQKQQSEDLLEQMPLKSMINRFIGKKDEDD